MAEMTKEYLAQLCAEQKGYRTPSLNEQLYLHFKGFMRVENLEAYTGLTAVFLEGNALESLEGVNGCKELRCLYAHQNALEDLDGLEGLDELATLNVSNNSLASLEGVEAVPKLQTLQAAHNQLATVQAALGPLAGLPELHTLELSDNKIDGEGAELIAALRAIPKLAVLYLKGNPVVSKVSHYRKTLICAIPKLAYLDDRPIFENERRCAEAWQRGGLEAEREERRLMKEEEAAKNRKNHEYLQGIREAAKAKRLAKEDEEKRFFPGADLDEFEEWEPIEEPPELVAAREKLAQFEARPDEEEPAELSEVRRQMAAAGKLSEEPAEWQPLVSEAAAAAAAAAPPEQLKVIEAEEEEEVVAVEDGDLEPMPDLEDLD